MKWLLVSFVILIFGFFNFFAPIRGGIQYIFNPIQFGFQETANLITDWISFYQKLKQIHSKNLQLMEENDELLSKVVDLETLKTENETLKEQLNVESIEDLNKGLILAQTLGNAEDKTQTSLVLDKGSLHGVSSGDMVIKGGYLIGIVRDVTQQRSKVELTTSPTLSVSVIDLYTGTEGISQGQFGTSLLVNRILPGETVRTGDLFLTSGRDGLFSPGYIIGEVSEVGEVSADVMKNVSLRVLLDFEKLGKVFVIPGK